MSAATFLCKTPSWLLLLKTVCKKGACVAPWVPGFGSGHEGHEIEPHMEPGWGLVLRQESA